MMIPPETRIVSGVRQILRRTEKIGLIQIIRNDAKRTAGFCGPAVFFHLLMSKEKLSFQVPSIIFQLIAAAGHLHDLQRMTTVIAGNAVSDDLDRGVVIGGE